MQWNREDGGAYVSARRMEKEDIKVRRRTQFERWVAMERFNKLTYTYTYTYRSELITRSDHSIA